MAKLNMVQALNLAFKQEMAKSPEVVVLGEDVGLNGGVFRVTDGLFQQFGEKRSIDTPLAESGIMGVAVGMALAGMRPVAELQFDGFSYAIINQLETAASRYRSRTHGQFTVPLVVRMPYGAGVRALEHHSESRETLFAHIPGVKVVVPSGPRNARALLVAAIRDPDPVVFLEPKRSYRAFKEEVPDEEEVLPLGTAQRVGEGDALTVISWGAMMRPTLQAVEQVEKQRAVKCDVLDLLTLAPMDTEAIVTSVKRTGRAVVVQEQPKSLGIGSEVIARINDHALMYLEAPVKRVTGYDVVTPYFGRENMYIPSVEQIADAILQTLDF
jgi:pyruvate dehydrogenase E1 component beta subunit